MGFLPLGVWKLIDPHPHDPILSSSGRQIVQPPPQQQRSHSYLPTPTPSIPRHLCLTPPLKNSQAPRAPHNNTPLPPGTPRHLPPREIQPLDHLLLMRRQIRPRVAQIILLRPVLPALREVPGREGVLVRRGEEAAGRGRVGMGMVVVVGGGG